MATISIDIEDNASDLATATGALSTALTNLQNSTLSNLSTALADLGTAVSAVAGFQITFTASVTPPPTPPAA